MTEIIATTDEVNEPQNDDIEAIFGDQSHALDVTADELSNQRKDFEPWHHPVKQVVRDRQWASLTSRLLKDRPAGSLPVLKYFTLPGRDLLDVHVLSEACEPYGVKIQYFGFNSNLGSTKEPDATWVTTEAALRQSGRITDDALVLSDRLEDIALENSQAAEALKGRLPFDVINIDACDHLAYSPPGREHSIFDALNALLRHQMRAHTPWLLFITTRVSPSLLAQPGLLFQDAINKNLLVQGSGFGAALATCIGADAHRLAVEMPTIWGSNDNRFLKLYSVGLGKFLLQFFNGQPNLPANVELASLYTYRVHGTQPDMLALAFRITPDAVRVYAPNIGGAAVVPDLEPSRAIKVAQQAVKLQDLDHALETEVEVLGAAVNGTRKLLQQANYDLTAWQNWLAELPQRPLIV